MGLKGSTVAFTSSKGPCRLEWLCTTTSSQENLCVNYALMSCIQKDSEPTHIREVLSKLTWKQAVEAELDSIERNQTWELVPRPAKRKVIGVKWVYKIKYKSDGTLDKHKATLVAKDYSQNVGVDFHDTFVPTARMATIRTVLALALAAHSHWPIFPMDVKSAFLNGELKEKVYVK